MHGGFVQAVGHGQDVMHGYFVQPSMDMNDVSGLQEDLRG
jgi:hypothetical protein